MCPHCEAFLVICADDFDLGKKEEVECWDCEKIYYITKRAVKDCFDFDVSRR